MLASRTTWKKTLHFVPSASVDFLKAFGRLLPILYVWTAQVAFGDHRQVKGFFKNLLSKVKVAGGLVCISFEGEIFTLFLQRVWTILKISTIFVTGLSLSVAIWKFAEIADCGFCKKFTSYNQECLMLASNTNLKKILQFISSASVLFLAIVGFLPILHVWCVGDHWRSFGF